MFAIQLYRNTVQSTICMLLATIIVSSGLTLGALGLHSVEQAAIAALSSAG